MQLLLKLEISRPHWSRPMAENSYSFADRNFHFIYYNMVNSQASQMNNPALWFVTCEWTTCSYHAQLGLPGAPRLQSVIPFNNSFLTKLASLWWTRVTISLVTLCYKTRDYYTWYPTGIEMLSPFRTRSRSELVAHTSWDSKHVSV